MTFEIHVSDLMMFRECRRRWYLGSKTQKNLESIVPKTALWLGTAIHFGLEMYNGSLIRGATRDQATENMLAAYEDWVQGEMKEIRDKALGLSPEQEEELTKAHDLGMGILIHYSEWCPQADEDLGIEYVDTEVNFEYPLSDEYKFAGRFDGLVRRAGKLWILENKTAASLTTEHLLLDEQAGAYVLAARLLYGEEVAGIMYNFMRKKVPAQPKVLVGGELSQDKRIDTTYERYMGAILEAGQSPLHYAGILEHLRLNAKAFFKREFVSRSTQEIWDLRRRFLAIAKEMHRAVEEELLYPSPGKFSCQRCSFVPVCLAMAEGADWRFILDTHYQRRPEHDRVRIDWGDE